jgi:hypothetical protein
MADSERDRLALLVTEAMHLRWYVGARIDSSLVSTERRDRAREALPAVESRMYRRQANLRNLDALIELDVETPDDISREAARGS